MPLPPLTDADKAGIRQGVKDGFSIESLVWIYGQTTPIIQEVLNEGKETPATDPTN
jgi:hypothetical protein